MNAQILTLALLVACCQSALPPSFKKCNRHDSDFPKCFQEAVQNAISQLNVPFKQIGLNSIDPVTIPSVSISAGNGPVGFDQNLKDLNLYGWSKCKCDNVAMNFDTLTMGVNCICPTILAQFQYEFSGRLLIFPLSGKGHANATITRLNGSLVLHLEEYKNKNKDYYKLKSSEFGFEPENIHFYFENLFGSDKALSDNLNKVFNDNWEIVYKDVAGNYEAMLNSIFGQIVAQMLTKVSVEDLFGDK